MIHLSVGLGEQPFLNWSGEQGVQLALEKRNKMLFSEKGNGCFFLWKMWSLTGVRQNKMNMKARTHFHMLFWDLWVRLNPLPHGKSAHTYRVGYFCSPTKMHFYPRGYRNTKLHFEFLRQNTSIRSLYQELDILQAAAPVCTMTELPPGCSLISVTQGRSLWPYFFLL